MASYLLQIVAKSNLASTLRTDTEAIERQNVALAENTALHSAAGAASKSTAASVKKDTTARVANVKALDRHNSGVSKAIHWLLGLDSAQTKVGYNIAGFSIRVGAWFMPLMGMMYLSMLPVIGALLAMGSAALVAAGGLVGVLGVGALLMNRRMNKSGGYAGARRPYADNTQTNVLDVIMNPIFDAFESATLNDGTKAGDYAVKRATMFFKTDLPGAISAFLRGVDRRAMDTIMNMFTSWLPAAANGLAKWGSQIFKLIGPGSLSRFSQFIKWIAGGIMGMALWLEATDWRYIDQVTALLSDVCSTLMEAGKNALPVFAAALSTIWPFPLKPMIEVLGGFFKTIGQNESALNVLTELLRILVTIKAFKYIAGLSVSLIGVKATLVGLGVIISAGLLILFGAIMLGLTRLLSGVITWGLTAVNVIGNIFKMLFMGILDAANQLIGNKDNMWSGWRNIDVMNDDWMSGTLGLGPNAMKGWQTQFDDMYNRSFNENKQKIEMVVQSDDAHIVQVVSDNVSVTEKPLTSTRGTGRPGTNTYLG